MFNHKIKSILKQRNARNSKDMILIETKLTNKIKKEFNNINKEIVKVIESLDDKVKSFDILKKNFDITIESIVNDWIAKIVKYIINDWQKVFKKSSVFISEDIWLGISWDQVEVNSENYFNQLELDLAWDLATTTLDRIKNIIRDWVSNWDSYWKIADEIKYQWTNWVFSKDRSEMIAVNEMGKAYENWKKETIKEFKNENEDKSVYKKWVTVWDARVTDTHRQNESDWWIPEDWTFSWTWDSEAPWSDNPRCRCSVVYKVWW